MALFFKTSVEDNLTGDVAIWGYEADGNSQFLENIKVFIIERRGDEASKTGGDTVTTGGTICRPECGMYGSYDAMLVCGHVIPGFGLTRIFRQQV